ncbi:MAG: FtsQ-type POTRA domain-containing protein [Methylococcales bacterium]|nr:FtsQ-type POTRA domain-containing protein [Methylococcales bacterium]MBT7446089.1 FtsQ-type POTRA domain-containing protein [Methylococcales bacterium]
MPVWIKRLSSIALLSFFAVTGYWVSIVAQDATLFPIKTVKVEGVVQHINQNILSRAIAEDIQQSFFVLDVHSIQKQIQGMPWVEDVIVQRTWPYTLKLTITEQIPVAIWNWKGLVNGSGEQFKEEDLFSFANLPVLVGDDGHEKLLVKKLFELQKIFDVEALSIREIAMDQRYVWQLTLRNGIKVTLSDHTEEALVKQFIKAYKYNEISNHEKISTVDLRYQNGFSIKWTPGV